MSRGRAFIRAEDVSVNTQGLTNVSGRRVQEAIESIDTAITTGGGGGGASSADQVSITDAGNHFTGTDVEAALQELATAEGGGSNVVVELERPPILPAWYQPMFRRRSTSASTVGGDLTLNASNAVERFGHLSLTPTAAAVYYSWMTLPPGVYDKIAFSFPVGTANATIRTGLYAPDGIILTTTITGGPGTLLAGGTQTNNAGNTRIWSDLGPYTHDGGGVWVALQVNGTGAGGSCTVVQCEPVFLWQALGADGNTEPTTIGQFTGAVGSGYSFGTDASLGNVTGMNPTGNGPLPMIHRVS